MQKHKKWLVITIWISTIAFVGAGFVGWGSYNYGKSGGTVATVGSLEIDMKNLEKEYSTMYGQYQQMFGGNFNQEMADKLNLQEQAYNNLVQKYLILNLAKKYGIIATDTEVAKELVKYEAFLKDGKFDKDTYIKVLQQNRTNPTDFENGMKNDIVFYKTISIFNANINTKEMKTLNEIYFSEDEVSINIIDSNSIDKSFSDKELKDFWEKNKNNYKTVAKYKINVEKMAIEGDLKQAKNNALKKYLALKNKKENFTKEELIDDKSTIFGKDLVNIMALKNDELLKPIQIGNEFVIVKMVQKIEPTTLSFEEASLFVKNDFLQTIVKQRLDEKKNALLKNFTGTNIGFISKEKLPTVASLTKEEIEKLAQDITSSTTILNTTSFGNKVVVYKIESSRAGAFDSEKNRYLLENIAKIKNDEIIMSLLDKLKNEYTTKSNMEVKQK
jgi:peptidyl-prolyl cis-trans isomerase D